MSGVPQRRRPEGPPPVSGHTGRAPKARVLSAKLRPDVKKPLPPPNPPRGKSAGAHRGRSQQGRGKPRRPQGPPPSSAIGSAKVRAKSAGPRARPAGPPPPGVTGNASGSSSSRARPVSAASALTTFQSHEPASASSVATFDKKFLPPPRPDGERARKEFLRTADPELDTSDEDSDESAESLYTEPSDASIDDENEDHDVTQGSSDHSDADIVEEFGVDNPGEEQIPSATTTQQVLSDRDQIVERDLEARAFALFDAGERKRVHSLR